MSTFLSMILEVFFEKFLIGSGKIIIKIITLNRYSLDNKNIRQQGILGLVGFIFWILLIVLLLWFL